jgi:hypothetical protein
MVRGFCDEVDYADLEFPHQAPDWISRVGSVLV